MKRVLSSLACMTLLGLAACTGGGGGGGAASNQGTSTGTLTYVNPTGYQSQFYQCALVRDASSTSTRLVLDVIGPTKLSATGLTFAFDVDTAKAVWTTSPVVTNGNLLTGVNVIAQGWVAGGRLQGIVTAKGLGFHVADAGAGIIATITLTAGPGAASGPVSLTDSGFGSLMDTSGPPAGPVAFSVGTLTLN